MSTEHPSQTPEAEILALRPIVEPLTVENLLATALARIQPDDTKESLQSPPPDDSAWAEEALRIADVLFRDLTTRTFDPDSALNNLAWYLRLFHHDPSLLRAATSLIQTGSYGCPQPPQNATSGDWRSQVLALRSR